jgi:hypothetical protein
MLSNINTAIVILVVLILLHLFPETRKCIARSAPWLAVVGGSIAVGLLLVAGPGSCGIHGGGEEDETLGDDLTVRELQQFIDEEAGAPHSDAAEYADLTPGEAPQMRTTPPDSLGDFIVNVPDEGYTADGAAGIDE